MGENHFKRNRRGSVCTAESFPKGTGVKVRRTFLLLKKCETGQHDSTSSCLVAQSSPTPCDPTAGNLQDSSVMGFPRQVYWSELPCPAAGLEVGSRLEWTHKVCYYQFVAILGGIFCHPAPLKPSHWAPWLRLRRECSCPHPPPSLL